jgi:hypothetical protein
MHFGGKFGTEVISIEASMYVCCVWEWHKNSVKRLGNIILNSLLDLQLEGSTYIRNIVRWLCSNYSWRNVSYVTAKQSITLAGTSYQQESPDFNVTASM